MSENTVRDAYFQIKAFLDAVDSIQSTRDYPPSAKLLWQIIKDTTEEMRHRVFCLNIGAPNADNLAKRYVDNAAFLHTLLDIVNASQAKNVPQAIVAPLERVMRCYTPDARIIIAYSWLYPNNYCILSVLAQRLKSKVAEIFEDPQNATVQAVPSIWPVIFFSPAEKENVLLHVALGHEIGHAFSAKYDSVAICRQKCTINDADMTPFITKPDETLGLSPPDIAKTKKTEITGTLYEEMRRRRLKVDTLPILTDWLDELISDAWSIYLLGPASLFALHGLVPIQLASKKHPPGSLRFKLMKICLEKTGFIKLAEESDYDWMKKHFQRIESDGEASKITNTDKPEYKLASIALEKGIFDIAEHVLEKVQTISFEKTNMYVPYLSKNWLDLCTVATGEDKGRHILVDRLLNFVPPDCINGAFGDDLQAADAASIMNAGWAVYLGAWDEFCRKLAKKENIDLNDQYVAKRKLNRLLLKGFELSDLIQKTRTK